MANVKITDLSAIADPASTDVLPVVDVTADTTNKISIADILKTAPEGTAAAPAIAFEGDSNTGIYHPGSEQIGFATSGIVRVFIASNGSVGIGTSSADALLKLQAGNSDIPANSFAVRQNNGADTSQTTFSIEVSPNDGVSRLISSATSGAKLAFYTQGNEVMRIDSSANVGIGTSSPGEKLEVNGTIKATDINFTGLSTFADDSAAGTGGLTAGDVYKTSTGELRIKL